MSGQPIEIANEPIRVLILENHQITLRGLRKIIEDRRPAMEVVGSTNNANEVLKKVSQFSPDVVLVKYAICTPGLIKAISQESASRVIVMLDEFSATALEAILQEGARGLLYANSSEELVVRAIEQTYSGGLWLCREAANVVFNEYTQVRRVTDQEIEKQSSLTARERKIIGAIVESGGTGSRELAKRLCISESTLRNHLTSIYQKLGVTNRVALYAYALKHGITTDSCQQGVIAGSRHLEKVA